MLRHQDPSLLGRLQNVILQLHLLLLLLLLLLFLLNLMFLLANMSVHQVGCLKKTLQCVIR